VIKTAASTPAASSRGHSSRNLSHSAPRFGLGIGTGPGTGMEGSRGFDLGVSSCLGSKSVPGPGPVGGFSAGDVPSSSTPTRYENPASRQATSLNKLNPSFHAHGSARTSGTSSLAQKPVSSGRVNQSKTACASTTRGVGGTPDSHSQSILNSGQGKPASTSRQTKLDFGRMTEKGDQDGRGRRVQVLKPGGNVAAGPRDERQGISGRETATAGLSSGSPEGLTVSTKRALDVSSSSASGSVTQSTSVPATSGMQNQGGAAVKRRLGMGSRVTTTGYANKKFKLPTL